jgi:hypothetical protein
MDAVTQGPFEIKIVKFLENLSHCTIRGRRYSRYQMKIAES